ncbi:MAG: KilA-N domain-containing protein, partial [Verrucomicrobiota bacterium]
EQLVVLSNLESINAVLIRQSIVSSERLRQLNEIAISQMTSLVKHQQIQELSEISRKKVD